MGEIRIKSENLYPILIGEDKWNNINGATHNNNNGELVVSMMGTDNNSGVYSPSGSTIKTVHNKDLSTYSWSVEIKADSPAGLLIGFEGDGVKIINITNEYQKFTFNNQSFISDRAFVIYNRTGVTRTVYLRNFMLNEGSTALPYQPYFLNRPAHQFVNGQRVDIPTHHFINSRWQGELTSQSPLKFWADGEMLDWRVEGKTSGNLFDVKHFVDTAYRHNVVLTQLDNGIRIQATSSDDPYVNYTYWVIGQALPGSMRNAAIPCKPNTDYTLCCAQSSIVGKYLSYFDKNYIVVKGHTMFSTELLNFKTSETCVYILLRIGDSSTLSEGKTIDLTDIQLLEGTYTPKTIPEYEPYGGVGDWDETTQKYKIPVTVNGATTNIYTDHQLMDGDSIDYATDQTAIPIATGNNTLTVDTAVQPDKVFVKFEG